MKKLLILGLFPVFLLSFVSKWYIDLGFRIPYYLPVAALWALLVLPSLCGRRTVIPDGLQLLIFSKFTYLAALALSFLALVDVSDSVAQVQFAKGLVMAVIDTLLITAILLFLTKLSWLERVRVLRLYVVAVTCLMAFMVTEALGMYIFRFDINEYISNVIPFWTGSVVSISDDMFAIEPLGVIYRLTGFTGDPNVTGTILALVLPLVFYCHTLRPRVSDTVFILSLLLLIISTVSNTAIAIAGLLLLLQSSYYWNRRKLLVAGIAVSLVLGVLFAMKKEPEALHDLVSFKLSAEGGTASTHLTIAKDALEVWRQHPMGLGFNNFALHSEDISTHNSYVQSVVELGVIGLTTTFVWIGTGLWLSYRSGNAVGMVAMLTLGSLGIAANGHDLLFRFEFQLFANMLVAMAILERCRNPIRHRPVILASGKSRTKSFFGGNLTRQAQCTAHIMNHNQDRPFL